MYREGQTQSRPDQSSELEIEQKDVSFEAEDLPCSLQLGQQGCWERDRVAGVRWLIRGGPPASYLPEREEARESVVGRMGSYSSHQMSLEERELA